MTEVAAILLAAGAASRFRAAGGVEASKLVANFRGEPLVRSGASAALSSRAKKPLIVVTGHACDEIEAALSGIDATFVHNPDYASGLSSSLKVGVAALPESAGGALILLGDMPSVSAKLLDRLIAAFAGRPEALAVIPVLGGERGNPALLSRALFAKVAMLEGDEGARRLLRQANPQHIVEVELDDAAIALDVDTPEDLEKARLM
jgi:molybdenum cofactor cytidylyltransferase